MGSQRYNNSRKILKSGDRYFVHNYRITIVKCQRRTIIVNISIELKSNASFLLGEVAGFRSGPNTEFHVTESRFCRDTDEFGDHERHKIRGHGHRCPVIVPYESRHSNTAAVPIWNLLIPNGKESTIGWGSTLS
jgi:hypothetical protein